MRHVPRGSKSPPASLSKADKDGKTELDYAITYYEGPPVPPQPKKAYPFSKYKGGDVKTRLDELFFGKCAYCESFYGSTAPVDVEHFRPKGGVEGEVHKGYWWLAATWDNLLPSCIFCNRRQKQRTPKASASLAALQMDSGATAVSLVMGTGKQNSFPIAGTRATHRNAPLALEQPLLLNPCEDQPELHLAFSLNPKHVVSVVYPVPNAGASTAVLLPAAGVGMNAAAVATHAASLGLSVRGAVSIQVFGLNRLGLVQQRTSLLRHLEFLGSLIIDMALLQQRLEAEIAVAPTQLLQDTASKLKELTDRIYDEIGRMKRPEAPHCTMVRAWLESFKARIVGP